MLLKMDEILVPGSSLSNRLRSLTIHKSMALYVSGIAEGQHIMSSNLFLPQLEVLCLRDVQFPENYHFPFLPRLRALQLAQAHVPLESSRTIVVNAAALPSLRSLELYSNHVVVQVDHRLFPQLTCLYLFGTCERDIVQQNAPSSWLLARQVKDFALGPLPLYIHRMNRDSFECHRPPPSTESLTIALWIDNAALKLCKGEWTFIETITNYLYNHRETLPMLKKLCLRVDLFYATSTGRTEPVMAFLSGRIDPLSQMCKMLHISLEVSKGFERWIGTRLSGRDSTAQCD